MASAKTDTQASVPASKPKDGKAKARGKKDKVVESAAPTKEVITSDYLPPLPLVMTVLVCSGFLFVFGLRDVLSTGRNIGGAWDEAMLRFTKSKQFFEDSRGWRSRQGGLSTVEQITTDDNNMGGLFVRKIGGAAVVAAHTPKLFSLLFHPANAQWRMGHFRPLLTTALIGNLAILVFYAGYLGDLAAAGADKLVKMMMAALVLESLVLFFYLATFRVTKRAPAVAMPAGKTPNSITSRIVARTVLIISTLMVIIAGRDLFFPGQIIDIIPADDIYLEWTNALIHSPPEGSLEAFRHGMEAPLYVGDKFLSQLMALHILILCLYKFVTALWIRYGSDGSGLIKCRMIWKATCMGESFLLFMFRLFASAAKTASLDLRWHLMCIGYETFILGLFGYF